MINFFSDPGNNDDSSNIAVKLDEDESISTNEDDEKSNVSKLKKRKDGVKSTDRYGFNIREDKYQDQFDINRQGFVLSEKEKAFRIEKEAERLQKWVKMMKRWKFTLSNRKDKLKRRIRKGIPDAVRGKVWMDLMEVEASKWRKSHPIKKLSGIVEKGEVKELTLEDIEKDIDRTFPSHVLFEKKNSPGQISLRNLLRWYAALDPETGYCQGMAFIAAMLLTYMQEEDAFYTLVAILNRPTAPLRETYLPDMIATQRALSVFGSLFQEYLPNLWKLFQDEGIHPSMFVTEWVMTVFTRNFSFEFVTRIWDIFIAEDYKIIYRVCLGLLKSIEAELLSSKFEAIMEHIRRIPRIVDIEKVLESTWSIPLQRLKIKEFEDQFNSSFVPKKNKK